MLRQGQIRHGDRKLKDGPKPDLQSSKSLARPARLQPAAATADTQQLIGEVAKPQRPPPRRAARQV